jgi:hypothetical protein
VDGLPRGGFVFAADGFCVEAAGLAFVVAVLVELGLCPLACGDACAVACDEDCPAVPGAAGDVEFAGGAVPVGAAFSSASVATVRLNAMGAAFAAACPDGFAACPASAGARSISLLNGSNPSCETSTR